MDEVELVVFDLGGTTIQDNGQVPKAFTAVLQANGLKVSAADLQAVRGASKRAAIRRFVERQRPAADVEAVCEQLYGEFQGNLVDLYSTGGAQVIPGVNETFAWLRQRGIQIALNTGFDRMITALLVQAAGWGPEIAIACADDVSQGRPAPYLIFHAMQAVGATSVHRVASVGDTVLDLQAGWNAGVRWNIGVLSGAHTRLQLEQAPHSLLLPGVADLPGVWENLERENF
jgi:phosphonatase-like hydrolase